MDFCIGYSGLCGRFGNRKPPAKKELNDLRTNSVNADKFYGALLSLHTVASLQSVDHGQSRLMLIRVLFQTS